MRQRTAHLPLLPLLCLLAGCTDTGGPAATEAPPDSAAGEVRFEYAGPAETAIVVPVHINGTGPHRFALDTGATLTCIDEQLSAELGLPERSGAVGFGAGVGQSGPVDMVMVDTLRVGAASATDVTACALDLEQLQSVGVEIDGLLGLNFLKEFRLSLDFDRRVLILQE